MAADLQPVAVRPQVIGVVDHPGREPQRAALESLQGGDGVGSLAGRGRLAMAAESWPGV